MYTQDVLLELNKQLKNKKIIYLHLGGNHRK